MISNFPLLQKELIEYASRRRTFIFRVLYGAVLYLLFFYDWSRYTSGGFINNLGSGRYLLELIILTNLGLIFLILPTTSASLIVSEKEKQTLPLLFICKIKPFFILFEKYFAAMIPTLTLVLMSLPLLYMSTLFGGVDDARMFRAVYSILLTMLQVTAIGIMFSCYCQNTVQAIVYTYIAGFSLYVFFPLMHAFINVDSYFETMFFPPGFYFDYLRSSNSFGEIIAYTIPIWISIFVCLLCANFFFLTRLNKSKSPVLHKIIWDKLKNKKILGIKNRILFQPKDFPHKYPIYWREKKNSMSFSAYLSLLAILSLLFLIIISASRQSYKKDLAFATYAFVFVISALVITMKSCHIFSKEYKSQNMEVLFASPISNQSMFFQKFFSLLRINAYMLITIIWFFLLSSYYYFQHRYYYASKADFSIYFYDNLTAVAMVLLTAQLVNIWLGLTFKRSNRLALISLAVSFSWCVLPIVIHEMRWFGYIPTFQTFSPLAYIVAVTDRSLPGFSDVRTAILYSQIVFACLSITFAFLIYKTYSKSLRT